MKQNRVEESVELLCQKGCRQLWADIDELDQGGILPETSDLSCEERALVLAELKSIMAVYEGSCCLDDKP